MKTNRPTLTLRLSQRVIHTRYYHGPGRAHGNHTQCTHHLGRHARTRETPHQPHNHPANSQVPRIIHLPQTSHSGRGETLAQAVHQMILGRETGPAPIKNEPPTTPHQQRPVLSANTPARPQAHQSGGTTVSRRLHQGVGPRSPGAKGTRQPVEAPA